MKLFLTNTISGKIEEFIPLDNSKVKLYVCGPTVYDYLHIGNGRSAVIYDLLYRILKLIYGDENVVYVRNITDVDDKINNRAKELNIAIEDLTSKTIKFFHDDMIYLNCQSPTYEPKATEHINDMLNIIDLLIENNHAYELNGNVYFSVQTYNKYGELSGRNLSDMLSGVRVEIDENKKNTNDFILWKSDKENYQSGVFDSKWGRGRPGWHIECSAMSHYYLGENFDIHGGGADLIFPHHTNEIAQSVCAFKNSNYAKYWVHNGFLTVNGEKMSKSLGNFLTINDLKNSSIDGEVVRFMLLNKNYRSPLDYNEKSISDSKKFLDYCYRAIDKSSIDYHYIDIKNNLDQEFLESLLNDLNTYKSFVILYDIAKKIMKSDNKDLIQNLAIKLFSSGKFVGLFNKTPKEWFINEIDILPEEIENLIEQRRIAKINKNYELSDSIRKILMEKNIKIEDGKDGKTLWGKIR